VWRESSKGKTARVDFLTPSEEDLWEEVWQGH